MKISLFASSVRPQHWSLFLDSLKSNTIEYEVVFAGPVDESIYTVAMKEYPEFRFIKTGDIKPAQCYEIARRECKGELVHWTADDCEYSEGILDNIYKFWCKKATYHDIISAKTDENATNNNLNDHRFFGWNVNTPQMAPLGFMNRETLNYLGGIDQRYISGQYENDIVMRLLMEQEGVVLKFEEGYVNIAHQEKHGNTTKFWTSYQQDRKILEDSWVLGGYQLPPRQEFLLIGGVPKVRNPLVNREVLRKRLDKFEPYPTEINLTQSHSFKGMWR